MLVIPEDAVYAYYLKYEIKHQPKKELKKDEDIRIYTVILGDTLKSISRRYAVSISKIKALNMLKEDYLMLGQKLLVPQNTK